VGSGADNVCVSTAISIVGYQPHSLGVRRPRVEVAEISMALNTMLTEEKVLTVSQDHRGWRLATGVVVGSGLLVIPTLVTGPDRQPIALLIAEALACSIVVGIGRQGIDVLLLRLIATGVIVTLGWVVGGALVQLGPLCPGLSQCDLLGVGMVSLGVVIAPILAIGALPTWIVWNRGSTGMRPEIPWRRLLVPRTWWHWAAVLGVLALLFASCIVAFPTPP
jgi:hypothetical protein